MNQEPVGRTNGYHIFFGKSRWAGGNRPRQAPQAALRAAKTGYLLGDFRRHTQNTQIDTEVTESSRRGTERSIGVNAIADFAHQVDPNLPGPDPNVFLCDLMFVLSGLCDEIGLRNLG